MNSTAAGKPVWFPTSVRSGSGGGLVHDPSAIGVLWCNGFFGKGVVSRGRPHALAALEDVAEQRAREAVAQPVVVATATAIPATVGRRTRRRRKAKQPEQAVLSTEERAILFRHMLPGGQEHDDALGDTSADEPLWLAPEELFFLVWRTGCLHVIDQTTQPRAIDPALDATATSASMGSQTFACRYAVYEHLRNKGWIVRDGIKYGADYVIYERGPTFDHSIDIRRVSLDWTSLLALVRVCNQVRKADATRTYQEPASIRDYRIEEATIRRWVPERNRL
ncbi:hypothetical protein SYNPS1DRAFT_21804 [Syncephalis pseudoplumigaleata]|uniref:tRNA-intron lyase n=1 Tax=Syncephalis pseudoplumigaleata TaxID=1712513 RepID=A0A4V1J1W1_9FUNG|nr:hypothetical protein SYNPS1DRAFT_21804 [Syncephalis pseudoplumigaleata]|eukprot:RKP26439.1 hypothetical protein SYNPS1DRAFT_21804 [Syncephalis pseudoplumigaleata]